MRPFWCLVTILNTIDHLGSGPNWVFDIDALTKSMNYKPVVVGNQTNGNAGTKAYDDAGKAGMETVPGKDYILLPMWPAEPLFSQNSKVSPDAGFKPSGEEEMKDAEDPRNEDSEVSKDNAVEENIVYGCADDPNMPELEDIIYSNNDEDVGAEADMNNLDAFMPVSPIPTTRIHKDHPVEQIIRDLSSVPQTKRMTKNLKKHEEPKKVIQALKDPSWIEAMQDELLQFKLQKVWTLVDLPNGKRAIGTKWVYRNKKDERGIVIKNKVRLVAQGYTQEEGIDYDDVFATNGIGVNAGDSKLMLLGINLLLLEKVNAARHKLTTAIENEAVNEEPIMQLKELMDFCTKLQQRVLDLENTKTAQAQEITSLKKRVKKLEKKGGSRTHKLKRLYKVGRSARVVSSEEASLVSALTITNVELTLAQTLAELKSTRPKIKGVVMQKPSESTPTISLQLPSHVKGQGSKVKGKAKVIDPEKPLKKKDQIKFDEKEAFRLQAKFDEEDRLAKEKAELLGISQHCCG
ncbi:putative ribonuclease H-like domain-containing protein [Tanacetum coccineum]